MNTQLHKLPRYSHKSIVAEGTSPYVDLVGVQAFVELVEIPVDCR